MQTDFDPTQPIFLQLVERITNQILQGKLKPGEKMPSVREMAIQYAVNPNTLQRAYSELENQEIVVVRRGEGTFVTDNLDTLESLRQQLHKQRIKSFIQDMQSLGLSKDEILKSLCDYLELPREGKKGKSL